MDQSVHVTGDGNCVTAHTQRAPQPDKPSIGRVVHYVSYGTPGGEYTSQCRAAIVTAAGAWVPVSITSPDSYSASEGRPIRHIEQWWFDDAVALAVMNPTGQFFNEVCRHDETEQTGGTWHWPERVA